MSIFVRLGNEHFVKALSGLIDGTLCADPNQPFLKGGSGLRQMVDTFLALVIFGQLNGSAGEYQVETNGCGLLQLSFSSSFIGVGSESKKGKKPFRPDDPLDQQRFFRLRSNSRTILSWQGGSVLYDTPPLVTWDAGSRNQQRTEVVALLGGLDLDPALRPQMIKVNDRIEPLYWPTIADRNQPESITPFLDRGPVIIYENGDLPSDLQVGGDHLSSQTILVLRREGWRLTALHLCDGVVQEAHPIPLPAKLP